MLLLELPQSILEIERKCGVTLATRYDRSRQVLHRNSHSFSEDHGVLDHVVELAHVAFPRQRHEDSDRFLFDALIVFLQLRVMAPDEMIHEQRNVLGTLS